MSLGLDNYSNVIFQVSLKGFLFFLENYTEVCKLDDTDNIKYLFRMYFNNFFKQQGEFYYIKKNYKQIKSVKLAFKDCLVNLYKEENNYQILYDLIDPSNKRHFWSRFLEEGHRLNILKLDMIIDMFYNNNDIQFLMELKIFNKIFTQYFRQYHMEIKTRKLIVKLLNNHNNKIRNLILKWIGSIYIDSKKLFNYYANMKLNERVILIFEMITSLLKIINIIWNSNTNNNELVKIRLDYTIDKKNSISWVEREKRQKMKKKIYMLEKLYFINHKILGLYLEIYIDTDNLPELDNSIKTKIKHFVGDSIYWLNFGGNHDKDLFKIVFEDIVFNIAKCYINLKIDIDENMLFKTLIQKIEIDKLTNTNLICDLVNLISIICGRKKNLLSENCHIINILVNCFNTISQMEDYPNKYFAQYSICLLFIFFESNNISLQYLFNKFIDNCNENLVQKKLYNGLMDSILYISDRSFSIIKEHDDVDEIEHKEGVGHLLTYLSTYLKAFTNLIKINPNLIITTEIKGKLSMMLNGLLLELTGPDKAKLNIKNKDKINFSPIELLINLKNIYYCFQSNSDFIKILVEDEMYYRPRLIKKMVSILIKKMSINLDEEKQLRIICSRCVDLHGEESEEIDIPDEFLDPIMSTLIETPVFLPNTDIIMDKFVISRHLLSSDENPFNREKLNLDILEEYNSREEINIQLLDFKKRYNDWNSNK